MGSESVGSTFHLESTPDQAFKSNKENMNLTFENVSGHDHGISPNNFLGSQSPRNICYSCNQLGHWAKDCPSRVNKNPSAINSSIGLEIREKQCPCGRGICLILTSRTKKNPGRKFYHCPMTDEHSIFFPNNFSSECTKNGNGCGFFEWCDVGNSQRNEINQIVLDALDSDYPMCSCGAGKAKVHTFKDGPNADRQCFICPIKKGEGACDFKQWRDVPKISHERTADHIAEDKQPREDANTSTGGIEPKTQLNHQYDGHNVEGCQEKEELGSNCGGRDARFPPIASLSITEGWVARKKPGKCYGCGEEGHWMSECVRTRHRCYKCGKVGHWMKDCPSTVQSK